MSNGTEFEKNFLRDFVYYIYADHQPKLFWSVYEQSFWTWKWRQDDTETSFALIRVILYLNGHKYLIITDYFSFSTEVRALKTNSKASLIIREVKDAFSCFGNPIEAVSDGGPQFKSNGEAKAAVKNVKKLLKKCGSMNDKFCLAGRVLLSCTWPNTAWLWRVDHIT